MCENAWTPEDLRPPQYSERGGAIEEDVDDLH